MKRPPSSFLCSLLLMIVGMSGTGVSMLLTADRRWMEWHLSRLGEGGHVSSLIFNLTVILCAVCLTAIGSQLHAEFRQVKEKRAANVLRAVMYLTAFCWIGVALFPFDRFPVTHNIFGYSVFFLLGGLILALPLLTKRISRRTHAIGLDGVVIGNTMMILFHLTHFTTLLVVELVGQVFFLAWLLSLTHETSVFRRTAG